ADILSYTNTSTSSEAYAYVVTDENNIILDILSGDSSDFDGAGVGVCRVWGLSFSGNVLAQVGDDAAAVALTDECFELSSNFIIVNRLEVDGGTVATTDGATEVTACTNDGVADIFSYTNTSTSSEAYAYVVTDENNIILDILSGDSNDFDGAGIGICRVWGLSFTGNVLAQVGDDAAAVALTDECFELSSNFITVTRKEVDGGMVALTDGSTEVNVCANDGVADILSYTNTSTSSEAYAYVVTDENNIILDILSGDSSDFDGAGVGVCRVWGLSFSGNVLAQVGDDAAITMLTDECFELSSNFITVNRLEVDGGMVATTDGATEATVCVNDGVADVLAYTNTSTSSANYAYVVTDDNNIIIAILEGDSNDFDGAGIGICRVWGLSFTGNVLAQVGDDAAAVALTDECFELSSNFVTVTRKEVDGGTVALADGGTEVNICANDGVSDVLTYTNTSASSEAYAYVVTDENNIILDILDGDSNDFDGAGLGICRVWGLSFSGNVLAQAGDDAAATMLTDECFELSSNFITVNRLEVDGGMVTTTDGATEATVCVNDGIADILSYTNTSTSAAPYVYVVTDENNIILEILSGDNNDFDGAGIGICRVWGLSFTGNVLAQVGDDAAITTLTDECFELSENFITVTRKEVDGGMVALSDGGTEASVCVTDGEADVLSYTNTSTSSEAYAYVVTDENNIILEILDGDSNDFDGAGLGVCRVWGLSFSGNVLAQAGDDAAVTMLTDECFELSSNFITVTRKEVDGGTLVLADGSDAALVCIGGGTTTVLDFSVTTTSTESYVFVITDEDNTILALTEDPTFDFADAMVGICRIWGLSYSGNVIAALGDDAGAVALSDECFDLSSNFITVTRRAVDGGTVAFGDGTTDPVFACVGDEEPDVFGFVGSPGVVSTYAFIITDENNEILNILSDGANSQDFNGVGVGICRVWGLSYTGNIIAEVGQNAALATLTDECFDLSNNFLEVIRDQVDGGMVSMPNGSVQRFICPGDGIADIVNFDSTGSTSANYIYVITDTENVILDVVDGDSFNFDQTPDGICRVWGLAYSGELTATIGDDADEVALSDACFDLSDNFIRIIRDRPDGGDVSTPDGEIFRYTCPGDGVPDIVMFDSTTTSNSQYLYLITDDSNFILDIVTVDFADFEDAPVGICRVWGLAFTGLLTAEIGDNAGEVALSDDCFDLSDSFITVIREVPEGGQVTTSNEQSSVFICPGDDMEDVINFDSIDASNSLYVYVVTDEDNVILEILDGDEGNFDTAPSGICRVWGLAYTGTLTASAGDNAAEVALSDDCFDLSDNFVTLIRETPNAGVITANGGQTEFDLCVGDGTFDLINFEVEGASNSEYLYLVTNDEGFLIGALEQDSFDFEFAIGGTFLIYGLAYTGNFAGFPGDNIFEFPLSTDCFDITETPLTINSTQVDGAFVTTNLIQQEVFVCPGDGEDDFVTFINTTSASMAEYVYIVTTESNLIVGILPGSTQNFENTGFDVLRVWGVSYTGEFLGAIGQNAAEVPLSDDCFALSGNFVTIIRDEPDGGMISDEDGATEIDFCIVNGDTELTVVSTTESIAGYLYLLTDEDNIIIDAFDGAVDFADFPQGTYRIWGLSYTGLPVAEPGMDASMDQLASSCFELSENFMTITIGETVDGGILSTFTGETTIYTCPGDDIADIVALSTTSLDTMYRYVITDTLNQVLQPDIEGDLIDFDAAAPGVCRIYGISFTGDFDVSFGENVFEDALSTDCWAVSENFITLVRQEPEGGMVATLDGSTAVEVIVGDEEADIVEFEAFGAGIAQYIFVITDDSNNILALTEEPSFDFEEAPAGICRIWGLSYTGMITAQIGDNAAAVELTDDCFDLSDNFITVTRTEDENIGGTEESPTLALGLTPNPAVDWLAVEFDLTEGSAPTSFIQVMDFSGSILLAQNIGAQQGRNRIELPISDLTSGTYIVRVINGNMMDTQLFVKQQD
ncbi:MAG: T9SS type A sorting domain-containing protein, partial [Bacteroidota bacterium]